MNIADPCCPTVPRVLLLTLGGATYDVLVPLAEAGTMPNLAQLLRSAALARLRFGGPLDETVAWATLESGGGPEVHGILDECYLDHRQRRLLPSRKRPPAFRTLHDLVAAADAEPAAARVSDAGKDTAIWQQRPSSFAELSQGIARTEAVIRQVVAAADTVDRSTPWRLLEVRLTLVDLLLHRLWHSLGISAGPGASRQWVGKAREAFHTLDECLGELLALAERRAAAAVVVSPYGFSAFREKITLSELLRRHDLLAVAQGSAKLGYRLSRLAWKVRRQLTRRPRCQPVTGLLAVNMRRTRAVSFHGQSAALVYLNTPERFGGGLLRSSREREQAIADAWAALQEAQHPVTGETLFADVYSTAARFDCDPLAHCWPELVAIPAGGFYTRHRLDRHRHLMRADWSLRGCRSGDGLLMVRGPEVVLGEPRTAGLSDVAPTVLALLGQKPAASMTGRVVAELFRREPALPQRHHHRQLRTQ